MIIMVDVGISNFTDTLSINVNFVLVTNSYTVLNILIPLCSFRTDDWSTLSIGIHVVAIDTYTGVILSSDLIMQALWYTVIKLISFISIIAFALTVDKNLSALRTIWCAFIEIVIKILIMLALWDTLSMV